MRINKLKPLTILLFLNNVKSINIQPANNQAEYRYQENRNINNRFNLPTNATTLELAIQQNTFGIIKHTLDQFILEILNLPYSEIIFTIQNITSNFKAKYQVTRQNNLTKIQRTNDIADPSLPPMIYEKINYTVLALSSMGSDNMQSFLENNAAKYTKIPNAKFYINNGFCLGINNLNHSYYIFEENNMEILKNIPDLASMNKEEEKENICFSRKNLTFQNIALLLTLSISAIGTIIVPLVGKKITQE